MSLQSRLATLITAIGTDIKSLNTNKVAKAGDVMTGDLEVPKVVFTPSSGTAKGRIGGLTGIAAWNGMFLNASFNGSAWVLDDTSKPGWFFKLDSRAGNEEFAVWMIPAGANPHTDEVFRFKVSSAGLVSVAGKITGVANASAATDALPKGQADALYASGTIIDGGTP